MRIALGTLVILVGSISLIGQLLSTIDFELAQRLGLQEKDETTEPLFRRLEQYTARWDIVLHWTLPLAGVLMVADHRWWPYVALVASGVYLDTAGREAAKHLGLRAEGVRIGGQSEVRLYFGFVTLMAVTGLAVLAFAVADLA